MDKKTTLAVKTVTGQNRIAESGLPSVREQADALSGLNPDEIDKKVAGTKALIRSQRGILGSGFGGLNDEEIDELIFQQETAAKMAKSRFNKKQGKEKIEFDFEKSIQRERDTLRIELEAAKVQFESKIDSEEVYNRKVKRANAKFNRRKARFEKERDEALTSIASAPVPAEKPKSASTPKEPVAQPQTTYNGAPADTSTTTSRNISTSQGEQMLRAELAAQGITDPTEVAAFLAQMAHESGNFKYMEEIASGQAYEGRRDLGNVEPGDGRRFKGRGFIQLTGRSNYETYGRALGIDLVNNPQLASEPKIAATVAVEYWNRRVRPNVSDFNDTRSITKLINGGFNGLADRQQKFAKYMQGQSLGSPNIMVASNTGGGFGNIQSLTSGATAAFSGDVGGTMNSIKDNLSNTIGQLTSVPTKGGIPMPIDIKGQATEMAKSRIALLQGIEKNLGLKSSKSIAEGKRNVAGNRFNQNNQNVKNESTTIVKQGMRHKDPTMETTTGGMFIGG